MAGFTLPKPIVRGTVDAPPIMQSSARRAKAIAASHLQTYGGAPHRPFPTDAAHFRP